MASRLTRAMRPRVGAGESVRARRDAGHSGGSPIRRRWPHVRRQIESDCFAVHRAQAFHLALEGTYTKLQAACYGSTLSSLAALAALRAT